MDLDDQSICAGSDGSPRDRRDVVRMSGGMRRIEDDRQVRQIFQDGNCIDVRRISCGGLEGANSAFSQHHLFVATRENVFCRHQ